MIRKVDYCHANLWNQIGVVPKVIAQTGRELGVAKLDM